MANILKGEVPLPLTDGRELTLVFDMEALIEAEGAFGFPMNVIVDKASKGFMGALRALLYGALRAHHPDLSLRDVANLIAENSDAISTALTSALDEGMPDAKASAEGKAVAAKRRPGGTSGKTGAKRASTTKRSGGSRPETT
ncbi:MAG: hypothetical protein VYD90_11155 [Pseudomonadota bacterium]|nr:hypothetical protein [Pseudomonadota bacterium]